MRLVPRRSAEEPAFAIALLHVRIGWSGSKSFESGVRRSRGATGCLACRARPRGGGEASAVLVGGESGVGKSRLVSEFETVASAAGARFLAGACVDVGGSELPYAPLVAALRTLARETEPD